jgi:poly-gamma-glutamate capsule biosynthesis protein CapA/YwtB (metallophosphatase superfamily)
MLKYVYVFILALVIFSSCQSKIERTETKKIVFVGDLLLDRGVRERIEHLGIESLFHRTVDSVFSSYDIVVANLECPATKIEEPISKKYIFIAEPEWLNVLKKHGITHLNLANNHSMDQGRDGLVDTKENISESGMIPLGYGKNIRQACKEELIETEPRNIYVVSSSRIPSENWTYLEDSPCICEESIDNIAKRVNNLRKQEPECVIIIQLHWGAEHTFFPLTSQKQDAYKLIDSGADCIIGHHSHTVQLVETYKERPIYYGIGNYIFDQSKAINSRGIMVLMEIEKSKIKFDTMSFQIKKCIPQLNAPNVLTQLDRHTSVQLK